MRRARGRGFYGEWFTGLVAMALLGSSCTMQGQTLKLKYRTASEHGFVLRDPAGAIIASGEATQVPSKHRITLHVVFHFRDGSIDDETTFYSQGEETIRLISDRHIQRGKSFPHPSEVMIDVTNQQVSFRDLSKSTNQATTERMDLPPDTSNGH
jgi:hypothetical protein